VTKDEALAKIMAAGIPLPDGADTPVVQELSKAVPVKAEPAPVYTGGVSSGKLAPGVKKSQVSATQAERIFQEENLEPLREKIRYYEENKSSLKPAEVIKILDGFVKLLHPEVKAIEGQAQEDSAINVTLNQFNFNGSNQKEKSSEDIALQGRTIDIDTAADLGKPGSA